jgi:hypothetical protein
MLFHKNDCKENDFLFYFQAYYKFMVETAMYFGADKESNHAD